MELDGSLQNKYSAIEELIFTYEFDVWNYAFSLTRRYDVADDITQDVFLKAFQNLDGFRGDSSIKTWLLTITRNAVSDYRRLAFLRKVTLVDYILDRGTHPSAEKEVLEDIVIKDTWKVVLQLPSKLRLQIKNLLPI